MVDSSDNTSELRYMKRDRMARIRTGKGRRYEGEGWKDERFREKRTKLSTHLDYERLGSQVIDKTFEWTYGRAEGRQYSSRWPQKARAHLGNCSIFVESGARHGFPADARTVYEGEEYPMYHTIYVSSIQVLLKLPNDNRSVVSTVHWSLKLTGTP